MILVTGGTGFIGQALIRSLVTAGHPVRTLIRPSPQTPNLPRGVSVDVAVSSLLDSRGLRAAMMGVDTIYHLAGVERRGAYASLFKVDIQGTRAVMDAASAAGVQRVFFLSHLGADRASAYPVMKSKAIAESFVRRSGLTFTILRSALVYGPGDGFTTSLAQLLSAIPFTFILPGNGDSLVQPLWVEDLVTCMLWALDDPETQNQTYEIGGPEYFPFRQVVNYVMQATGIHRRLTSLRQPYLRLLTVVLESIFPQLPVSVYWLDYLATNRTCALDTIPRVFKLMPARMPQRLAYLHGINWRQELLRTIFARPRRGPDV